LSRGQTRTGGPAHHTGLRFTLACYANGLSCHQPPAALTLDRRRLAMPAVRHLQPAGAERRGPGPQRRAIMSQHHHRPPRMAPTTNRALRLPFASLAVCRACVQPARVVTRGRELRLGTWWDTERSAAAHVAGCSAAPRALAGRTGSTLRLSQRGRRLVVKVSNGCHPTP
jgi:hypothetical protein